MFSLRSTSFTLVASFLLTSGCIAEPMADDASNENVGEAEQASIEFANGVFASFFQNGDVQTAFRNMGTKPLGNGSAFLSSTAFGRVLIEHAVSCALAAGDAVMINGTKYYGHIGLATQWAVGPLDNAKEQRWVSACVLQSLNGFGLSIPIALTGANAALFPGQTVGDFTINDITAFGNLFGSAPKMYVCPMKDLELACGVATSSQAQFRVCGNSATCGMVILGSCSSICQFDENGSPVCTVPGGETYKEAISSTLNKDGFQTLYPDCSL